MSQVDSKYTNLSFVSSEPRKVRPRQRAKISVLTDGDKDIIRYVAEFRLVTIEHLESLTGRKTIWRRLPRLLKSKHVFKKERGINEKYVYACTPIQNRSSFTLAHELMITDIHVALDRTGTLVYWEQGKEMWRGQVHQDAFCTLENSQRQEANRIDYFIEADTGTENHQDIATKIHGYLEHFNGSEIPFRVLFVTTSNGRAENLAKLTETLIPQSKRKLFLFAPLEDFKRNCLQPVCFLPYETSGFSILPGLKPNEEEEREIHII